MLTPNLQLLVTHRTLLRDCLRSQNHMGKKGTGGALAKMRLVIFNGKPGKPTVVLYNGSGNGWDGSANFNVSVLTTIDRVTFCTIDSSTYCTN